MKGKWWLFCMNEWCCLDIAIDMIWFFRVVLTLSIFIRIAYTKYFMINNLWHLIHLHACDGKIPSIFFTVEISVCVCVYAIIFSSLSAIISFELPLLLLLPTKKRFFFLDKTDGVLWSRITRKVWEMNFYSRNGKTNERKKIRPWECAKPPQCTP